MAEHNSWSTTTIKPFPKASCVIFGKDMGIPSPKELWAIYIVDKRKLNSVPPIFLKTPTYPFYLLFILCFPSTSSFSRSQHKFRPSPFQFFFSSWLNSALLLEVDVLILRFGSVSRTNVHKDINTLMKWPFWKENSYGIPFP